MRGENSHTKFLDLFGIEITAEQKEDQSKYQIGYFVNDSLIKREVYENNLLINTCYYVFSHEEIEVILEDDQDASFKRMYRINGYSISEKLDFSSKLVQHKKIYVSDESDNTICFKRFHFDNMGNEIGCRTEKSYYEHDKLRYVFEYNRDETCFMIYDELHYQSDIYPSNIGNKEITTFTWSGFEYYQFAHPLFPAT